MLPVLGAICGASSASFNRCGRRFGTVGDVIDDHFAFSNDVALPIDLNIAGCFGAVGSQSPHRAERHGGIEQDHFLANDRDEFPAALHAVAAACAVIIDRRVAEESSSTPGFWLIHLGWSEASPRRGLAEIPIDIQKSCRAGIFIRRRRIPAGVNDEQVGFFNHRQKIADEIPVCLRNSGGEAFEPGTGWMIEHCAHRGIIRAIAGERFAKAVLHEPFVSRPAIVVGELIDIALAVENDVEDVVMISAAKAGAGKFEQEIDDPARIRPAIVSADSTFGSPRSITPSMIFLPARSRKTPRSRFGCAASIEICSALESASSISATNRI